MKIPIGVYLVSRPKIAGTVTHYGILMNRSDGRRRVFQLSNDGFRILPLKEFSAGARIEIHKRIPPVQVKAALKRAEELVKQGGRYNALTNNCEHAARWVAQGKKKSGQGERAGILGLILLGIGMASS